MKKVLKWIIAVVAVVFMAGVAFFWYLEIDDEDVRYSTDISHYAPLPENGVETFRKLMALSVDIGKPELPLELSAKDSQGADYTLLLQENQELINDEYEKLRPLFPRIRELAESSSIGDPTDNMDSPFPSFQALRAATLILSAKVDMAILGQKDPEAVEILADWMAIFNAWSPNTRLLVNSMYCVIIPSVYLDTVDRVFDSLSPEEQDLLLDPLRTPFAFEEAIARSLMAEFCIAADELAKIQEAGLGLGKILINKNSTINAAGDFLTEIIQLQSEGKPDEAAALAQEFGEKSSAFHLKNSIGWSFLAMTIPATNNVFKTARKKEAERKQLLERLIDDEAPATQPYEVLSIGMSRDEVREIAGEPTDNWEEGDYEVWYYWRFPLQEIAESGSTENLKGGSYTVTFLNGKVEEIDRLQSDLKVYKP